MAILLLMRGQRSSYDQPFLRYEKGVFLAFFGVFSEMASCSATLPGIFVIRDIKLTQKSWSHWLPKLQTPTSLSRWSMFHLKARNSFRGCFDLFCPSIQRIWCNGSWLLHSAHFKASSGYTVGGYQITSLTCRFDSKFFNASSSVPIVRCCRYVKSFGNRFTSTNSVITLWMNSDWIFLLEDSPNDEAFKHWSDGVISIRGCVSSICRGKSERRIILSR